MASAFKHTPRPLTRMLFFWRFAATLRHVPPAVFANLTELITGRPPPGADRGAFVESVQVERREVRNPRVERVIFWCWVLIAVKHVVIIWAVWRYHVPFHQLWINFPTWLLGVLATGIYYARTRRA